MKVLRLLPFFALLLLATPAMAQLDTQFLGNQPNMRAEPEFPNPGEEVTVSLTVPGSQLYGSEVVWTLNGQVVENLTNQRKITFVAGEIGSIDSVTASVISPAGRAETHAINIRSTYIDIVLEPQTRVPDFYKGRALPSVGSQINATVLVNIGDLVEGDDLLYTWRLKNIVLGGGPMRGTNQVSFDTPRGSRTILSVEVRDKNGLVYGNRAIYFESEEPEIVLYETDALYGVSQNAVGRSYVMTGPAATLLAEPYNLDIRTFNDPDIIEWEIDDTVQTNGSSNPYKTSIETVDEGGTAKMSFHVRSTSELLQGDSKIISIAF